MTHLPTARLALAALTLPVLLASCGGGSGSSSSATTPPAVTGTTTASNDPSVSPSAEEQLMLNAVNAARSTSHVCALDPAIANDGDEHLPAGPYAATTPLVWNASLMKAARSYANFMAAHKITPEQLDHSLDGVSDAERAVANGYAASTNNIATAENVSENYTNSPADIQNVVNAWLASKDGHCQAIMNPAFKEFGTGYNEATLSSPITGLLNPNPYGLSGTYTTTYSYWVQAFGTRY